MHHQRNQFRNNSRGQGTSRETQHQQNWPRKYHKDYSAAVSSVPAAAPSFDFRRMEAFMDTISKTMETLTSRLSTLEKGQPSIAVEPTGNRTSPVDVPTLMSSTRRSAPTWQPANNRPPFSRPAPTSGPATPPMQSANPDFHEICKALYRMAQLRRQVQNWKSLPVAIKRDIQRVADSINPVHPSDELVQDISNIFARTGSDLHKRVLHHFSERLVLNLSALEQYSPLDKERAVEVVVKQLKFRLGRKVTEPDLRRLVEGEAEVIGRGRSSTEVRCGTDPDGFQKPTNPAKKLCISKSPTTNTHNTFAVLSTLEKDNNDLEQDSPSPIRKQRILPAMPPPSRTSAAFQSNSSAPTTPRSGLHPETASASSNMKPTSLTETPSAMAVDPFPQPDPTMVPLQSVPTGPLPTPGTSTASDLPMISRFNHHSGENKASWEIHLRPDTEFLIVSDSNFKSLTESDIPPGFQLECFSGANFSNVMAPVQNLAQGQVQQLIIALGVNHRDHAFTSKTSSAMDLLLETCGEKTVRPLAAVGVSINPGFLRREKDTLTSINSKLRETCLNSYIEPLPDQQINISTDGLHYVRNTQQRILHNIIQYTKN